MFELWCGGCRASRGAPNKRTNLTRPSAGGLTSGRLARGLCAGLRTESSSPGDAWTTVRT